MHTLPPNSMNIDFNTINNHCEMCHETATALESILRRLTNLERGLQQAKEINELNKILNEPSDFIPSIAHNTNNPEVIELRRSTSVSSLSAGSEVHRIDLDSYLLPYLRQSPKLPSEPVLDSIVAECQRSFPHTNRAKILSRIKEWYRKRREYMTHRVYNYCNKHFRLREGREVLELLRGDVNALDEIREKCRLDVTDVTAAREFAYDRVESFFLRRKA